ncbi:MFS transporter [Jannaschia sp. R86511]|uniref:MFS transporter n=1 Tax=Jannaschia sp. R86511 TaxID=3093853 RepID=UPI0036D2DDC5
MPTGRAPAGGAVLAVLCAAQFVLILDVAVVNVALVPLARDLRAAPEDLQLVASVYAATFGGALLIGGRLADRGHRRRVFLVGLVLFLLASVLCGVAWSVPAVVLGRAVQGLGAALASPAALSLLTTTFPEGPSRDRALGTWASVAAAGGAAGLVVGGALAATVGWRSVFLVNVPIIAVVVVAARRLLPTGPAERDRPELPAAAGLAAAGAVVLLVVALGAAEAGARVGPVVALVAATIAAALAFVLLDRRAAHPLVPASLVRRRSVAAANVATAAMSAVVLGTNFFLAVHLQSRLGLGPLMTGLAFLPITAVSAVTAVTAARLTGRLGTRRLLQGGMAVMVLGCLWLARLPGDGGYLLDVLPGMVLVAAGMGPAFAVGAIAATAGVPGRQQGAAAALLSTSTQAGAAVGLAALAALAAAGGDEAGGTRLAFLGMAGAAALALAAASALPHRHPSTPAVAAPLIVPAHAAGGLPGCAEAASSRAPTSASP